MGHFIPSPGDVLIWTYERKARLVPAMKPCVIQLKDLERNTSRTRRTTETPPLFGVAVRNKQRETWSEVVIERRAVREPKMGREATRMCRGHIKHEVLSRGLTAIGHNNR